MIPFLLSVMVSLTLYQAQGLPARMEQKGHGDLNSILIKRRDNQSAPHAQASKPRIDQWTQGSEHLHARLLAIQAKWQHDSRATLSKNEWREGPPPMPTPVPLYMPLSRIRTRTRRTLRTRTRTRRTTCIVNIR